MRLAHLPDLFNYQLRELYSAERQVLLVWPQLAQQASSPSLVEAIELHHGETALQLARMIELLELLDQGTSGAPSRGMEGILATAMSVAMIPGDPTVIDAAILDSCIRSLSHQYAGYSSATATAHSLDIDQAAVILARSRHQLDGARRRFQKIESDLLRQAMHHPGMGVAAGAAGDHEAQAIPISSAPSLRRGLKLR